MNKSDLLAGIAGLAALQTIRKPDSRVAEVIETANIIAALSGKDAMGGVLPSSVASLGDVVRMIDGMGGALPSLIPIGGGAGGLPGFSSGGPAAPAVSGLTDLPATQSGAMQPAPAAPAPAQATPPAAQQTTPPAAEGGQDADPSKLSQDCTNKWLVVIVERHTKKNFNGVWDCTLGDMRMELWDSKDAGSGDLIMACYTVERGAARNQRTSGSATMILASEDYGINIHAGSRMKTYNYVAQDGSADKKPRPALAVYGSGFGAVGARTGICIHHASSHTWSVGCILLTPTRGAESGGKWRFGLAASHDTQMEFRKNVLTFAKLSTARTPAGSGVKKLDRVRLIIREKFE